MKTYKEPKIKYVSLASEETMAAMSAQVTPDATPVNPSEAESKSSEIVNKSIWEE